MRPISLSQPAFDLPPAVDDETKPTGRIIARPRRKSSLSIEARIDVIRELSKEAWA